MTPQSVALSALLVGAASIGTAPIFVRLSETGPVATAFWRGLLAIPFLAVWVYFSARKRGQATRQAFRFERRFVLPGLYFAGDLAVWHIAIMLTTVANATLEANLAPIFVTLFTWLVLKQRPRGLFVAGLVLAVAGMLILIGPHFGGSSKALLGDGLGVLTAVFYAGYILTLAKLRADFDTASLMFWNCVIYTIVLLPIVLVRGEVLLPISTQGWWVLVGLAFIAQVFGQSLIAYALAHLPATFSSVGLYVQPIVAAAIAWLLFAEVLNGWQILGGIIVIAGIALAKKGA